jgi:3-oxoacid CoA-transferase subunit B
MKGLTRELMCLRAAKELREGAYVNLGTGLPSRVKDFVEGEVILQAENGMLGFAPTIWDEELMDYELIDASAVPVGYKPGISFFDISLSFAMLRGGHVDVAIVGAFQVSEKGDLANFKESADVLGTPGGILDICTGVKRLVVVMEHVTKDHQARIVRRCSLPVTARGSVNSIITNLAYIEDTPEGLVLKEIAPDVSVEEVERLTEPSLIVSPELRPFDL